MKSTIRLMTLGVLFVGFAGAALADGAAVVTRSTADMEADLMRTYQTPGGSPAGHIRIRNEADAHADLMRDWSAKADATVGQSVHSRAAAETYADMMRIWGPLAANQFQ
jgi:hypothetical protein